MQRGGVIDVLDAPPLGTGEGPCAQVIRKSSLGSHPFFKLTFVVTAVSADKDPIGLNDVEQGVVGSKKLVEKKQKFVVLGPVRGGYSQFTRLLFFKDLVMLLLLLENI